jgi:hypothetical protein
MPLTSTPKCSRAVSSLCPPRDTKRSDSFSSRQAVRGTCCPGLATRALSAPRTSQTCPAMISRLAFSLLSASPCSARTTSARSTLLATAYPWTWGAYSSAQKMSPRLWASRSSG